MLSLEPMHRPLWVLLLFLFAATLRPEFGLAQTYPEVAVPETHVRLLRSPYGRQVEHQISIALPLGYAETVRSYPRATPKTGHLWTLENRPLTGRD